MRRGGTPSVTCPLALRSSRCATLIEHQPVELRAGRTVEQDMRVNRIVVTLDSIRVLAQRSRYREFDENRKHRGIGKFFDEGQIRDERAFETSDLIRMLPE